MLRTHTSHPGNVVVAYGSPKSSEAEAISLKFLFSAVNSAGMGARAANFCAPAVAESEGLSLRSITTSGCPVSGCPLAAEVVSGMGSASTACARWRPARACVPDVASRSSAAIVTAANLRIEKREVCIATRALLLKLNSMVWIVPAYRQSSAGTHFCRLCTRGAPDRYDQNINSCRRLHERLCMGSRGCIRAERRPVAQQHTDSIGNTLSSQEQRLQYCRALLILITELTLLLSFAALALMTYNEIAVRIRAAACSVC